MVETQLWCVSACARVSVHVCIKTRVYPEFFCQVVDCILLRLCLSMYACTLQE